MIAENVVQMAKQTTDPMDDRMAGEAVYRMDDFKTDRSVEQVIRLLVDSMVDALLLFTRVNSSFMKYKMLHSELHSHPNNLYTALNYRNLKMNEVISVFSRT